MIAPAIRYISSFQDATNSSEIPLETPVMVDGRIWDKKNLNVASYRSGRPIPQVKTGWSTLTTGAWRYYNDNPASAAVYGRLYNWYALMGIYDAASLADPSLRDNIAPIGWDIATYGEWITLRNILGRNTAAIALKESGTYHWGLTNTATNSSYFTALPGGYKLYSNNTGFNRLGSVGYWWQKDATGFFNLDNISNALGYTSTTIKTYGFSIRLIKTTGVIPGFTTTYPTTITSTSLLGTGGHIPTSYSGTITERGIVYGTSPNPTIANAKIQSGTGTGSYTINITGLSANTEYYIRAYAISSIDGLVYANNISVFTLNSTPTVFTNNISYITTNSAESGGFIDNDGGLAITAKGVCWSTSPNPTIALSTKTNNGSGIGAFVSEITGLALNTKYYVRAYATNSSTTGYGQEEEFTTLAVPSLNLIFNQYVANHAYSLRRLSSTYDYKCLRVRRTASVIGTTTVDVFFNSYSEIGLYSDIRYVSGVATLATNLGEFAASINFGYINVDGLNEMQDIFVTTWYDQSGNNINVINNTGPSQPKIISAGTLELDINNKVAVRFIGGKQLNVTNSNAAYNNESIYVVGSATTSVNAAFYGQGIVNANARLYIGYNGGIWYNNSSSITNPDFTIPQFATNVPRLYELICNTSTTSAYTNGEELIPFTTPSLNVSSSIIRVGAVTSAADMVGLLQEVICLVGTPLRDSIEPNIMDYYGIQKTPLITTADVNYTEPTGTAIGGGNVTEDFGTTVTAKGVCWNTFENPAINFGASTNNGTGIGSFTSSLNFLSAYTSYYVRAYAVSAAGTNYGQQKQFTTGNAPYVFILDAFTSAHHAYSLRKLRTAYTGFCLRVRRTAATTTEVNVGFDTNGTISFSSPISFASGTATNAVNLGQFAQGTVDGLTAQLIFVSIWYDQSGNGKNTINATASAQPRLVRLDTGVATLETSGGKVAVRFESVSSDRLTLNDTTANINNMSSYFVGAYVTATGIGYSLGTTNRFYLPYTTGGNTYAGYGGVAAAMLLEATTTNRRLYELIAPTTGSTTLAQGFLNGIPKQTIALVNGAIANIVLGAAATIYYDGYIQEVIGWQTNANRGEKEMNINNYWQIY